MHRLNIFLTALLLALLITVAFRLFPVLNHFDVVGWMYFPAIVATVLMSGNKHAPSEVAGWIVGYTLAYWGVFFVIYAILLELSLIRRGFRREGIIDFSLHSKDEMSGVLQRFGVALTTIESRRRQHFFLRNLESLNLADSPEELGAHAIANLGDERLIKAMLKHFQSRLAREMGKRDAVAFINELKEEANTRARGVGSV
jgi:hypothetical protein